MRVMKYQVMIFLLIKLLILVSIRM